MVTAIDTNVLLDVFLDDPSFRQRSYAALTRALTTGKVIVSDVVWTETGAAFDDVSRFESIMRTLSFSFVPMPECAASRAATMWREAKNHKAIPPKRVVADFLVGAHALECADCLLTRDKGFYRNYFENLKIIDPSEC